MSVPVPGSSQSSAEPCWDSGARIPATVPPAAMLDSVKLGGPGSHVGFRVARWPCGLDCDREKPANAQSLSRVVNSSRDFRTLADQISTKQRWTGMALPFDSDQPPFCSEIGSEMAQNG